MKQLFDSDIDHVALDQRISREVGVANKSYQENQMIVNPEKHHAMILFLLIFVRK